MMYINKHGRKQKRPSTHKGKSRELGVGERCKKTSTDVMTCHRLRYAGDTCQHIGYDAELHARGTPYGKPKSAGIADNMVDDEKLSLCIGIKEKHEERKANYPLFAEIVEIKSVLTTKEKFPLDSLDKKETKSEKVRID